MAESQQLINAEKSETGLYAFVDLDRMIHERARLGILTALNGHERGLLFNQLRDFCSLSDGNLSRHLTTLKEAGLIEIWKGSKEKKSQTLCVISDKGRDSLSKYVETLQQIIAKINNSSQETTSS